MPSRPSVSSLAPKTTSASDDIASRVACVRMATGTSRRSATTPGQEQRICVSWESPSSQSILTKSETFSVSSPEA